MIASAAVDTLGTFQKWDPIFYGLTYERRQLEDRISELKVEQAIASLEAYADGVLGDNVGQISAQDRAEDLQSKIDRAEDALNYRVWPTGVIKLW
jgi:hypothetical protein